MPSNGWVTLVLHPVDPSDPTTGTDTALQPAYGYDLRVGGHLGSSTPFALAVLAALPANNVTGLNNSWPRPTTTSRTTTAMLRAERSTTTREIYALTRASRSGSSSVASASTRPRSSTADGGRAVWRQRELARKYSEPADGRRRNMDHQSNKLLEFGSPGRAISARKYLTRRASRRCSQSTASRTVFQQIRASCAP